jgi:hypothetical protein
MLIELVPSSGLIYSNVYPWPGGGQTAAVPFSVGSAVVVEEVAWWGVYEPGSATDVSTPSFTIELYADESGAPAMRPSSSFRVQYPKTDTGRTVGDGSAFSDQHILEFVATIPAVPLAAAVTYWLSIAESDLRTGEWLWSRSTIRGAVAVRSETGAHTDSWWVLQQVHLPAFRLSGSKRQ